MTSFSENPHSDHLFFPAELDQNLAFSPGFEASRLRPDGPGPCHGRFGQSPAAPARQQLGLAWIGWDGISWFFLWIFDGNIGISGFMEPIGRSLWGFFIVSIIMVMETRI